MRKRILPVIMCFMLLLTVSAQAATTRAILAVPNLSFSGTTANCGAMVTGNSTSDKISATLTLYQGSTEIDSWTASGNGRAIMSETSSVLKNKSYTLTLEYSINGVSRPAVSVSGTCK